MFSSRDRKFVRRGQPRWVSGPLRTSRSGSGRDVARCTVGTAIEGFSHRVARQAPKQTATFSPRTTCFVSILPRRREEGPIYRTYATRRPDSPLKTKMPDELTTCRLAPVLCAVQTTTRFFDPSGRSASFPPTQTVLYFPRGLIPLIFIFG